MLSIVLSDRLLIAYMIKVSLIRKNTPLLESSGETTGVLEYTLLSLPFLGNKPGVLLASMALATTRLNGATRVIEFISDVVDPGFVLD